MEKYESSQEKTKTETGGLGLGLGVDLNLKLGELKNTLDMLTDTLTNVGEKTTDMLANAVRKFRDVGVQTIKEFSDKGGEQGNLYNNIVTNLRQAADRGEEEARSLLRDLGEKVETGGQKMQSAAEEDTTRH